MEFALGGQLSVRITPDDVGKRVSIRTRLPEDTPGARFTDTLGHLTSWENGVLLVTRRDGEAVRLDERDLVAAKVVPPATRRGRRLRGGPGTDTAELERIAARGWPAVDREPLGDWLLRAADGFTWRANSTLALGDPGVPVERAVDEVADWYHARGLPGTVVVVDPRGEGAALDALLEHRGWTVRAAALLSLAPLPPLTDAPEDARVRVERALTEEWLTGYRSSGPEARAVLTGGPSVWFVTVPDARGDGTPAARGRCVVEGRWAGFNAVEVSPRWRRHGLATAVMAALARVALSEGATTGYLQVEPDNEGALALYEGLGFVEHHRYHYRVQPRT
ncbi:GNAT family N-acetyltransferase [Streptomyces sp. NPDC005438]|uniref:GNAT family N-acetyltransferase n=1 Tax=Streptomyces sp. NPDC005438 TaxID=3156880 RepID=UPI0033A4B966